VIDTPQLSYERIIDHFSKPDAEYGYIRDYEYKDEDESFSTESCVYVTPSGGCAVGCQLTKEMHEEIERQGLNTGIGVYNLLNHIPAIAMHFGLPTDTDYTQLVPSERPEMVKWLYLAQIVHDEHAYRSKPMHEMVEAMHRQAVDFGLTRYEP
jgi:hypothetical protein